MNTSTPALATITRNGRVLYVVHGIIECTTMDAAMDLLYDRRVAPRSQVDPVCHVVDTDDGQRLIRWEGYAT